MRIMGIDVGEKRIGIALSDPLKIVAGGHSVLERSSLSKDLEHIKQLCSINEVELIVIGLPRNMNGSIGPKAIEIQEFAQALQEYTGVGIAFVDERLSTVAAERVLLQADMSRSKRKKVIDKLAAVNILQNYLDGARQ
ncbi:MAG: Holliday junction resolvase RuvX [Syntrophomonadaceae bacterium]|jgi:putative Holliday junction resolvase|nr:Holliday junction resolvase RuvX [Syntrophomonadaceae bacterium]